MSLIGYIIYGKHNNKETLCLKKAKIGDKVWSIKFGWGTIAEIIERTGCPIGVDFKDSCRLWYCTDGRYSRTDMLPSIFWNEFTIPDEAFEKPLPDIKVDTKILVWYDNNGVMSTKLPRHFHNFTEDGKIRVFQDGRTSFTAAKWLPSNKPCLETFDDYEIYKEE